MRRWGRNLAKVEATIDLTGSIEVSSQLPAVEGQKQVEAEPTQGRGSESSRVTDPKCVCTVPINPSVSLGFHSKLRAKQCKAYLAPDVRVQRKVQGGASVMVWLRPFDLRLHDQPALFHAAQTRKAVHLVFAWSDEEDEAEGGWQIAGTAAAFFLHHAIASLDASIQQRFGNSIVVRKGSSAAQAVLQAALDAGVEEVFSSHSCEPSGMAGHSVDQSVQGALQDVGIKLRLFNSFLLYDIKQIRIDLGTYRGHFGTLTPFHHACMAQRVEKPLPEPPVLPAPESLRDDGLTSLGFTSMPVRADGTVLNWGASILEHWNISETAALEILRRFLSPGGGLQRYEQGRQLADASAVTRISPYLRFGMLSSRFMFYEMKAAGAKEQSIVYWRRLVWRDLAYWQRSMFPQMRDKPIRAHYEGQSWNADPVALRRWQTGQTGFPLVDAGMRELWTTGWMAQNVRMAAAILLCEHLNIHWIEGEKWFHHTLVDADQAINSMMWQNAGKSGLDQWNFTMNAASAGKTQDPKGHYIRRWCPELSKLPAQYAHAPWEAPEHVLKEAGVSLGPKGTYPHRILVDLSTAAWKSAEAIREQRKRSRDWINDQGYDLIVIPRGASVAHDGQKFRVFTKPEYRNSGSRGHTDDGKGKGKSRSKGRGKGRQNWDRERIDQDYGHDCASSGQKVLDEYMRAWGA